MANNYMGNMTFGVNFKVDTQALNQLDNQFNKINENLKDLGNQAVKNGAKGLKTQVDQATKSANQLYDALMKSYNIKLGQFDIAKLNTELAKSKQSLSSVAGDLSKVGVNINSIYSTMLNSKVMIKESNQFLDKMAITFGNTVRWSITNKIINTITGSIQKAFYFAKDLDRSLNDIRIVTGKSADEMERFAKQATNAAQALGKTTTDYTKASLIYYQQGLGDKEVAARTETTLKAANVTGQSTSEVSEQLTAVWNGYKVSAEETELYVDKLAKVAASTASNLEELSTGMSKVASAANMMGVDIDQLNAQLSTVISVTRQAPETIGAAFKTVYARMSTISAGGIDEEDGATLKSYTEKMNQFGISVLDSNGKLRNMGEVIEEIGDKWSSFSREAQVGLAQAMGGTRQYSNLTALFENWDKYQTALKTSQEAEGTLQKQQDIYMDSMEAHFKQLTAEAEKFYQEILDEDVIKDFTDGLTFIVKELNNFVKGIGGAGNALTAFFATATNLFSHKIGTSFGEHLVKKDAYKQEEERLNQLKQMQDRVQKGEEPGIVKGPIDINDVRQSTREDHVVFTEDALKKQAENEQKIYNLGKNITAEQRESLSNANQELALLRSKLDTYKALEKDANDIVLNYDDAVENLKKWERELEKLQSTQKDLQNQQTQNNAKMVNLGSAGEKFALQGGVNAKFATADSNGNYKFNEQAQGTYRGYLNAAKEYYTELQKANALTAEQEQILKRINIQYDQAKAGTVESSSAEQLIKQIEDERLKVLNEIDKAGDNQSDDLEKAKAKAIELEEELKKVKAAIEGDGSREGYQNVVNQARQNIEQNSGIVNMARDVQQGAIERTETAINTKQDAFDNALKNQGKIQKTVKTVQGFTGAIRAANAALGGFSVYADKTKSAGERFNGAWEGATGTITGAVSAINPAFGLLASGITTLAKGILDATGVTEWFADKLKNDAERLDDTRNAMVKATEAVKDLNQRMSEQQNLTASYQSQLKSLDEIKESWNKIVNKMNAGIALTQSEQEEYENIKNQLIGLNEDIVEGYDDQHNAIINISTALDDVLTKLEKEYELQYGIKSVSVDDQVAAYNELLDKQEKYQKQAAEFKNSDLVKDASKGYNTAKAGVERGQVIDIYFDDTWAYDDEKYLRDKGYGAQFDTVKEFFEKYGTVEDALDKVSKEEVEAFKDAVTTIEKNAQAHRMNNADDIDDKLSKTFTALDQAVKINEGKEDKDATKELQNLIKNLSKDFKQNSLNENLSSANNDIISSVAEKIGTDLYEQRLNSGERLSAENKEKWEKEAKDAAQKEIDKLNKHSEEIENLVQKASQLELRRSKMTMKEYYDAKSQLYSELSDEVRTDTDLMNKIFGKGNYGAGLRKQIQGNTYETRDKTGMYVTKTETDLDRFLNKTGASENDINISPDDYKQFIKFMQEYTQNPSGDLMSKASENALGSMNWEDLWEGFQKAENPNFKMFHEKLPEITSELDEIKNMSLDGSALDEEKYEALLDSLDQYEYKLQDVGTEVDILHDKELYGSQLWYESLERVEKELRAAQDKALLGERGQLVENLELDTADAEQQLKDLTSKDYEVIVHLDTEGEDTYQTALKEIENMQKSLSYVGEEGKIAAENVYDFLNAFPEMNDMIKELNNDGSISLTKEQIQLVKERSEANITATLAEREIELKADLDRMQAEKDRIENQKTLIKEELSNWSQKEFNKEEFVKQFTSFYGESADTQVKITETDNDYMNDDTYNTSVAIAKYWDQASRQSAESYAKFAQSVITNNLAMEGKANIQASIDVGEGFDKINYESQKTQTEELLNDIQNLGNESVDQQKALLEQMLESLDKEGSLIDSSIEKQQNRMIALNAQGLAAVKNVGDLGKKTKETAWEAKHLYDYYHDVNKELEFISQKLTVLQKKQKLLEGGALLKNLKLQTKEYENQLKYLQEKRGIQEGYQQELQTRQKDELGNKGLAAYGITFDKNGYIENYAEIARKLQEGQHDKESVEDYPNFINQVKTDEDNLKLALDLEGQLYDVVAKRQELQGKAVEERIKMILDVADAKKKYMEFTKELGNWKVNLIINPDQTTVDAAAAKTANSFVKSSIKAMSKNADLVAEGSAAVDRLKAGDFDKDKNGNLTDYVSFNGSQYKMEDLLKMEEDVDKFADAASQSAADIQQAYQQTLDAYSNAMKELNDWDKRVLAKYDMINSVYDHAEKLTELWYGKDSLEAQIMLTSNQQDKTANLYEKAKEANKQVKEDWDIYQKAVATGNEKLAEEAYDAWSESVQNLQSLTEEYAEQRKKQLTDELALAAKIVETQIYGGKSREEFVNSWDLINKKAETYLDTINAQFGVTQLENKYIQAMNKMIGNTKAQEKINKIMNEEMKMLKEKDKLTKYDLERAEAKYDLTLKQIALEEARDNKTNLRLRRDSQGNYTYQYTANQDDILKAQNDVDIAKNNLYNMDRDRHQELTQQAIDLEKEYYDKLAEIQEKFADDEDARLAAEKELYDAYFGEGGIITGVLDERAVAFENLNESISESITGTGEGTILGSFEKLKEDLPAKVSELSPSLQPEVKKVIDLWSSHETGLPKAYDILRTDTQQFFTDYKDDIAKAASELDQDTVFGKVRTVFENTKTKVDEFKEAAGNANTAIGDLNTTGSKFSLEKLITQFETLTIDLGGADDPNGLITRIQQANTELEELVNPEQKKKNFKEIRKSLAKIRDTLDKNKDKFDTALKDIDEWKKKVIEHAKDAKTEIGLVADALAALKDKKVTVTVETVYTQKGSPTKDSDGTGPKQDLTPKPTTPSGDDIVGKTVYYVIPNQASSTRYYFESSRAAQDAVSSLKAKDKNSSADWGTTTTTQVSADAYLSAVSYDSYGAPRDIRATTKKIKELRTGGYTGIWGEEGKLAVLHEKELVLNKEDTENILDAVDLIRQIDMKQMQMNMMENYITALQRVQDKYALESSQPTQINQNITINADFPDATNRDEIKAAFDSLVNLASQRVMTKRH